MIDYRLDLTPPPEKVARLYQEAGWIDAQFPLETLSTMLARSWRICTAWNGQELVGLMRSLSDGVSDAYLLDLIVHEPYRKQGIGREIVNRLAQSLRTDGVDWIVLIGAPGTQDFYHFPGSSEIVGYTPFRLESSPSTSSNDAH